MKDTNIAYIDRLSLFSLIALILLRRKYSHIIYFNLSSTIRRILEILLWFRVIKVKPELIEFHLAEVRDESGEYQYMKIMEDILFICKKIKEGELRCENFLRAMGKYFSTCRTVDRNFEKLLLYYEKIISDEIQEVVSFVNVAVWHAREQFNKHNQKQGVIFFLEKNLWSKYIIQYADRFNIKLIEYRTPIKYIYLKNYFPLIKKQIFLTIRSKFNTITRLIIREKKNKGMLLTQEKSSFPFIAGLYNGRHIRDELKKTTDIFWVLRSKIPYNRIMIYFENPSYPATQDMVDFMKEKRIKFVALSRNATDTNSVPVWEHTKKMKKIKNDFVKLVVWNYFKNVIRLNFLPFFYFFNMYYFVLKYSYWYDFFNFNNIKININPDVFSKSNIPMNLALEKNGGISISYQWSDFSISSVGLISTADVVFSFGPAYKWVWECNDSLVSSLIYCGYITDHSFREVRSDSLKLRKQLFDKGVKFVICYFDENSSDQRMSAITNKEAIEIYRYFIEKVLEDETLGIIFKPKYAWSIYQRISPIETLLEKAKATGRCIFIDKGRFKTDKYPTEIAQASDLCVGLLLSGTVALESFLSGIPAVFIDLEKLYSNPIYKWGKGKVVFDNLDDLFYTIQEYRQNPDSIKGFGNLSEWIKGKDTFKDGNASLRIGMYINCLIEMFNQGKTREEAVMCANKRYAKIWGKKNIIQS